MVILSELSLIGLPDPEAGLRPAAIRTDIAIVDDDPVLAGLAKRVLTRQGYTTTWFADGVVGVAALCHEKTHRARLILLDVSMPGLDGFEVLRYLRQFGVLDQSKVIMLTASASEDDVRQAIGLGAIGYLAKPLDIRLLIHRVQRSLN
jgi:DNA-binding response OmpR family regulator